MAYGVQKKVEDLHCEITIAKTMVEEIISSLTKACNSDTNLSEVIGQYAREMPPLKILSEQRHQALTLIRRVCTYEISCADASLIFCKVNEELADALKLFKL